MCTFQTFLCSASHTENILKCKFCGGWRLESNLNSEILYEFEIAAIANLIICNVQFFHFPLPCHIIQIENGININHQQSTPIWISWVDYLSILLLDFAWAVNCVSLKVKILMDWCAPWAYNEKQVTNTHSFNERKTHEIVSRMQ